MIAPSFAVASACSAVCARSVLLSYCCCPLAGCSYITRRAKEEFHALANNADSAAAEAAWKRAQSQLEVWKRQSVVYGLYGRRVKNVMVSD